MSYQTGIPGVPGVKSDGKGGLIVEGGVKDADGNPIGGASLPGVTSDGNSPPGIVIEGTVQAGDADATVTPTNLIYHGTMTVEGNLATDVDNDPTFNAIIDAALTDDCYQPVGRFNRGSALNGHALHSAIVEIKDAIGYPAGALLRGISAEAGGAETPNFAGPLAFEFSTQGLLGQSGKRAPTATPAVTGTLTSATLVQLTSIVSQLLVILDANGTLTKSTT